jgi:hypothetical protein
MWMLSAKVPKSEDAMVNRTSFDVVKSNGIQLTQIAFASGHKPQQPREPAPRYGWGKHVILCRLTGQFLKLGA